jgi:hypothetical protein
MISLHGKSCSALIIVYAISVHLYNKKLTCCTMQFQISQFVLVANIAVWIERLACRGILNDCGEMRDRERPRGRVREGVYIRLSMITLHADCAV